MHKLQFRNFACIFVLVIFLASQKIINVSGQSIPAEFIPQVTATCKGGLMNIKVFLNGPYVGAVHARGYRNAKCMSFGNGSDTTTLTLNLQSKPALPDYCGVVVNNESDERSVQLAIRVHKTLELAEDKYYIITCGRTGVIRDRNTEVVLKFLENDRRVRELVYGHSYSIKAEIAKSNGTTTGIRVKNCIAFDQSNSNITLIDHRGCPLQPDIITKFHPNSDGTATAFLKSMFKFPEGSGVHLQCAITPCTTSDCSDDVNCDEIALAGFGSTAATKGGRFLNDSSEDKLLAATTVFVQEPSEKGCEQGIHPAWLLWLAITLGILFLIMLLMNIFLCTAMSCSCARTEIIEKEPSIIEEYDPYRSWHGSQYGSRYSLHGRDGPAKGYTSGGSTIHSNRSDRY